MFSRPVVIILGVIVGVGVFFLLAYLSVASLTRTPSPVLSKEALTPEQQQTLDALHFEMLLAQQRGLLLRIRRNTILSLVWGGMGLALVTTFGVAGAVYVMRKSRPTARTISEMDGVKTIFEIPVMRATAQERALFASGQVYRHLALAQGESLEQTAHMLSTVAGVAKSFSGFIPKSYGITSSHEPDPRALTEGHEPFSFSMPSFPEILTHLEPGDDLIFGYRLDTGEPMTGTFDRLYSAVLAGATGSGKTSWGRGLVYQSLQCFPGIEYYVLDPHEQHVAGLRSSLPQTRHFHYLDAHNPAGGFIEFDRRLDARLAGKESDTTPLVFLCDELKTASKRQYKDMMVKLFDRITEEGRKINTYLLALTQDTRARYGLSFRDSLESAYAFKMAPSRVKYLLQDPDTERLHKAIKDPGVAVFVPTDGESTLVRVPRCLPQHVQYLHCEEDALVPSVSPHKKHVEVLSPSAITQRLRALRSQGMSYQAMWTELFDESEMKVSTFQTKLKDPIKRPWTPEEQRRVSDWIQRNHARSHETV